MKNQLEQYFGCKVIIKKNKTDLQLPIFMTLRNIQLIQLFSVEFALVNIKKEPELSISAMKKQKKKYEEALKCPVAYEIEIENSSMRNALIKNDIFFIDLPGNVYLPFMGIVLQDKYKKKHIKSDKMMPATQMVFLELFYMNDEEAVSKSEIASKLNLTKTSITRATAQLLDMGLISQNKCGTEIAIKRNYSKREYYEKAKDFFINPIQKVITIKGYKSNWNMWAAGETALSRLSILNPPKIEEIAVYKEDKIVQEFDIVDERFIDNEPLLKVQLWKYNPELFANKGSYLKRGTVDEISLMCSFMENEDERIEMAMDEYLENFRWYWD